MRKTAHSFAYEAYDGPLLEEVKLYKAKSGEELINEQIYDFTDRGERHVAIRPEMTPTLARMVASVHRQTAKPLRWYAIPNLMRYEKPQRGRVREHWQFNVDIFGAPPVLGEVEILSLIVHFFKNLKADQTMFSILVNDRKIVDAIFNELLQLKDDEAYKLYKVIDKAKKVDDAALDKMISDILADDKKSVFKNYLALSNHLELLEFLKSHKLSDQAQEFMKIMENCEQLGLLPYIQYDPTIVRGLDYYTGLVFEIFDLNPENRRAIAGGGAYASLMKIFDEPELPGIGFGLGDVTLKDFLETHKLLPDLAHASNDLFLCHTEDQELIATQKLALVLREQGLKVELNLGKMKFNKIFKTAESKGHQYVAIVEEKDGHVQVQIKNLPTREAKFFQLSDISEIQNFIKDK
tara:strand:- start:8495 stop:9718 length:1224 start_codon:yes stop_codon:yes gene_type:complete